MRPVESILLFVNRPTWMLDRFAETLNARLSRSDVAFSVCDDTDTDALVLLADGMQLSIQPNDNALPGSAFDHATDGLLSMPHRGALSNILFRHNRHLTVRLERTISAGGDAQDRLAMLKIAHAATTLVAEWHQPAAVHWKSSNQLLLGSQYLKLSSDPTPWALFAKAVIDCPEAMDAVQGAHAIRMAASSGLCDRTIEVRLGALSREESYAMGLGFLRHMVTSGQPIPDGELLGPTPDDAHQVAYQEATERDPEGVYFLTPATSGIRGTSVHKSPPRSTAGALAGLQAALKNRANPAGKGSKGMWLSSLMLILLPPLGLTLVVTNLILGANLARTMVLSLAGLALVMLAASWMAVTGPSYQAAMVYPDVSATAFDAPTD